MLGFPCDQFGQQEPGDEAEIKEFCRLTYDVTFPLFVKIAVNGPTAHPLYKYLKSARRGFLGTKRIKWNFTKFLVDRDGNVVRRYGPMVRPEKIENDLRELMGRVGRWVDGFSICVIGDTQPRGRRGPVTIIGGRALR